MLKNLLSKRNICRLCDSKNLELAVPLLPTPVAEKYLDKNELDKKELLCPLDLYMCLVCGHVQLLDIVEPNFLYSDYTYSSGGSKGLVNHFKEYVDQICKKFQPLKEELVVDIGSNDGTLLKFFKDYNLRVLGVDPANEIALKASNEGVKTIPKFFNKTLAKDIVKEYGKAKIVTANNAFAHMDDLKEVMEGIKIMMNEDSIFVFEISYLLDVIEKVLLGTIFHEHHSYHSIKPLKSFFESFDMELVDITRNNIQGGSLVGVVQFKNGKYKINSSVENILNLEQEKKIDQIQTLKNFSKNLSITKNKVKSLFEDISKNKKTIAGFGAARSGTTLITQMQIGSMIEYIVDDNVQKQGKYSPGDHILVRPTNFIYEKIPDYLVILAWVHSKNIIRNHQKYLEMGGSFIVCFPELEIIKR
jgi:hypothetical protein